MLQPTVLIPPSRYPILQQLGCTTLFVFIFCFATNAQMGTFNMGARNLGMAGSSALLGDAYSLFNNVGGLGRVNNHETFMSYQNRFGLSEFQTLAAGAVYAHDLATAGIGFFRFGDDAYSEQRIHMAIGNTIQMVSLGLGVDLLQYNIATIGSSQALAIQFGGIAEISPKVRFGAHIFNFTQSQVRGERETTIPTIMKAGMLYKPTEELIFTLEVEKDLNVEELIKVGIEYQVIPQVFLRTGINTQPFLGAFGIGFHPKRIKIDYGFANDSFLGSIHELSLAYSIRP